jgi:hypothetical protein
MKLLPGHCWDFCPGIREEGHVRYRQEVLVWLIDGACLRIPVKLFPSAESNLAFDGRTDGNLSQSRREDMYTFP